MADERDPKISRRYRELGAEEPPRELDQAILAAAHRAADRPHAPLVTPAGRHRWYFAFGAVAILVLAVAITVQVERQPDPEAPPSTVSVPPDRADRFYSQAEKESKEQVVPSKPLADAGPPPVRERRKAPAQETASAVSPPPEVKPQAAEEARAPAVELQNAPAAVPASPALSQADSRDQSSGAATGLFSRQEEARRSREAAPAAAPSPDATARPQAKVQEGRAVASVAPPTPERLLERIAELRKEGRHDEADKALAEFRQRYPDYRIPEEILKKVERSK